MTSPEQWIDKELSENLPVLRDRGESQHLEFMRSYPNNGFELGKEIAAFASTNTGRILIGVENDGSLVGLPDLEDALARDALCRRVEGVCNGNIRPAITPVIKFAFEDGKIVLAIEVPRGKQPIYYSKNTPYIRHLSQSRPAEPHEVIERIEEWLARNLSRDSESDGNSNFLSRLAQTLVEILIVSNEVEQRNVNPWLDMTQTQLAALAEDIGSLSREGAATELGVAAELKSLFDLMDAAAHQEFFIDGGDSWRAFVAKVEGALSIAREVKAVQIDPHLGSEASFKDVRNLIVRMADELRDISERASSLCDDGRVEELQSIASQIGYNLLKAYYFAPSDLRVNGGEFYDLASKLRSIETRRVYMDGGRSLQGIVDDIRESMGRLNVWIERNGIHLSRQ